MSEARNSQTLPSALSHVCRWGYAQVFSNTYLLFSPWDSGETIKYTTTVEIDLPRSRVIELFDNPDNYKAWQESLVSMECLEGEPGRVGARTRLDHKMGSREVTMTETVKLRDLPDAFTATYEAKGVWNEAQNRFVESGDNRTTWTMDTEFRCSGMMWIMTTLMPGMFKKTTQRTMEAFKDFAESQGIQGNQDAETPEQETPPPEEP